MTAEHPTPRGDGRVDATALRRPGMSRRSGGRWAMAAGVGLCAVLFAASWAAARSMATLGGASTAEVALLDGPTAPVGPTTRSAASASAGFTTWDLNIEPTAPLAAWQVEVAAGTAQSGAKPGVAPSAPATLGRWPTIVGIEGGDGAFSEPAHYDPAALGAQRLVLGAYSLEPAERLPDQPFRAATLHLHVPPGAATSPLRVRLEAAAGPDGSPVRASATLVPRSR